MRRVSFAWLMIVVFLLSACATGPKGRDVVIDDLNSPENVESEIFDQGLDKNYVAMLNKGESYVQPRSAVASLLKTAEGQLKLGELEAAANTLERAVRMSPRNPLLWHQFATLRYQQGNYEQALQLARKSNSYAGKDKQLQVNNWRIIAHVKKLQGDPQGSKEALAQLESLTK